MLLLALDTATPAVTVALHDGEAVIARADQIDALPLGPSGKGGTPMHGELLLPAVDRVLREAGRELSQVTEIVAGVGPGPYTGLRVGLATAEVFGAARGVPVRGLCTLDGIAYAAGATGPAALDSPFVVATDARRKEVYWARYSDARTRSAGPAVDRPADIADQVAGVPAVGAGARLYAGTFTGVRREAGAPEHQLAAALATLAVEKLAAGEEFLPPRPLYLRRPDAKVPANYKVVTPR